MNCVVVCVVVVFLAGVSACWWTNDDQQETQATPVVGTLPPPTPTPEATATPAPAPTSSPTPAPTATPTQVPTSTPTPEATATPAPAPTSTPTPEPTAITAPAPTSSPTPEPTATPTPAPLPTPAPTLTPQSEVAAAIEDIKSFAIEANLDMSDLLTESDWPVSAHLTGWVNYDGDSQIFMQIDMSQPVDGSFEILISNSFDVHLRDVEEDQWYFIPENSDTGPLEDILSLVFVAHWYSGLAAYGLEDLKPIQGGYVWKVEDSWGSTMAFYNEEYLLQEFVVMDAEGHEAIRLTLGGHNEQYSVLAPEKGEPLPEDYWGSR